MLQECVLVIILIMSILSNIPVCRGVPDCIPNKSPGAVSPRRAQDLHCIRNLPSFGATNYDAFTLSFRAMGMFATVHSLSRL